MNKEQIIQCIHGFFNQERVRSTIATIKECNITGWEKWLQVEFAHYLQANIYKNAQHEFRWYREYKVITSSCENDNNKSEKQHIPPDFWLSSDEDEHSYYLVELKCTNTGDLETKMAEDINKWNMHIKNNRHVLTCVSDSVQYRNAGIFFVGVDIRYKDLTIDVSDCHLDSYGQTFKYRIDFLSW
ncbi:hypothetical protein [Vibrio cidicii]|uniref:hypothetical protein n=1 Tax=Vibrio cidicii TaxID=1763883 RepID=UPI0018C2837C|nr:hypothetical protein [Vibrio cidicii]EGR2798107.1 hypothetical protein [Vibrio navarrensis]MBG0761588.1 hypothetical protein [Vibrio cidicii]